MLMARPAAIAFLSGPCAGSCKDLQACTLAAGLDSAVSLAGVKGAAALSQVVIAAGALSGVGLILHKKSPLDDSKPLINYDLVLLMLPALLMGVSLGKRLSCLLTLPLTLLMAGCDKNVQEELPA